MQTTRRQVQRASVAALAVVCAVLAGTHAQDYASRRMMPRNSLHHHFGARIDDQGGPDPAQGAAWRQLLQDTSKPESAQPTEGSGPTGRADSSNSNSSSDSGGATVTVLPGGLRVIKPAGVTFTTAPATRPAAQDATPPPPTTATEAAPKLNDAGGIEDGPSGSRPASALARPGQGQGWAGAGADAQPAHPGPGDVLEGMVHVLEGHQGLTGEHAAPVYTLTTTPTTADDSPPIMYALEVDSVTAPRTVTGSFVRVTVGAHRRRRLAGVAGLAGAACGGSNSSAGMAGDCGATGRGQLVPVAGLEVIAAPGLGRGSAATRGAATSSSSSGSMQRQSPPPPSNTSSTDHDVAFASSAGAGTTSVPVLFILTSNCGNQVAASEDDIQRIHLAPGHSGPQGTTVGWFRTCSYGQYTIDASSSIVAYVPVCFNSCPGGAGMWPTALANAVAQQLFRDSRSSPAMLEVYSAFQNFPHVVIVSPPPPADGSSNCFNDLRGLAQLGGPLTWMPATHWEDYGTVGHELLHNLNLDHAASLSPTTGLVSEYGDTTCALGYACEGYVCPRCPNAPHLWQEGDEAYFTLPAAHTSPAHYLRLTAHPKDVLFVAFRQTLTPYDDQSTFMPPNHNKAHIYSFNHDQGVKGQQTLLLGSASLGSAGGWEGDLVRVELLEVRGTQAEVLVTRVGGGNLECTSGTSLPPRPPRPPQAPPSASHAPAPTGAPSSPDSWHNGLPTKMKDSVQKLPTWAMAVIAGVGGLLAVSAAGCLVARCMHKRQLTVAPAPPLPPITSAAPLTLTRKPSAVDRVFGRLPPSSTSPPPPSPLNPIDTPPHRAPRHPTHHFLETYT